MNITTEAEGIIRIHWSETGEGLTTIADELTKKLMLFSLPGNYAINVGIILGKARTADEAISQLRELRGSFF